MRRLAQEWSLTLFGFITAIYNALVIGHNIPPRQYQFTAKTKTQDKYFALLLSYQIG